MENNDKPQELSILASHKAVIDEYFNNGFNGAAAYREINGENIRSAKSHFSKIISAERNKPYLEQKYREISKAADIKQLQIVKELINYAYLDATEFINLQPDEVKQLPAELRRSIQSFEHKKHKYTDRNGEEHEEEILRIKFVDKLKAIDMINKHIGTYNADNSQKAPKININAIDTVTLNVLYQAIKEGQQQ